MIFCTNVMEYTVTAVYSGINSIKSPASDAGNVSEPMPVSHVGIMRMLCSMSGGGASTCLLM